MYGSYIIIVVLMHDLYFLSNIINDTYTYSGYTYTIRMYSNSKLFFLISRISESLVYSLQGDHQTAHLSLGFMALPTGHWKASLNATLLERVPITLHEEMHLLEANGL